MSQYAVCKDGVKKEFTKIHHSELEANNEAKRLCRLENKDFLVLQVIGRYFQEEKPLAYEDLKGEA